MKNKKQQKKSRYLSSQVDLQAHHMSAYCLLLYLPRSKTAGHADMILYQDMDTDMDEDENKVKSQGKDKDANTWIIIVISDRVGYRKRLRVERYR